MDKKVYKCKQNDVVIEMSYKSGVLDELLIGVEGDTKCGKTVIGAEDLREALNDYLINMLIDFQEELLGRDDIQDDEYSNMEKLAKDFLNK